jgi:hypothetical protein
MKVLGVVPSTTAIHICTLSDETATDMKKIPLPKNDDESARLHALAKLANTLLVESGADMLAILQAGRSQHGQTSPLRLKIECIFQLAAVERSVPVALVAPQSARAFEKKHDLLALTAGVEFSPVPCKDAALVAWYAFHSSDGQKH